MAESPYYLFVIESDDLLFRYAVILSELSFCPNTSDLELPAAAWANQKGEV